jgi:hypothetical protein
VLALRVADPEKKRALLKLAEERGKSKDLYDDPQLKEWKARFDSLKGSELFPGPHGETKKRIIATKWHETVEAVRALGTGLDRDARAKVYETGLKQLENSIADGIIQPKNAPPLLGSDYKSFFTVYMQLGRDKQAFARMQFDALMRFKFPNLRSASGGAPSEDDYWNAIAKDQDFAAALKDPAFKALFNGK